MRNRFFVPVYEVHFIHDTKPTTSPWLVTRNRRDLASFSTMQAAIDWAKRQATGSFEDYIAAKGRGGIVRWFGRDGKMQGEVRY